jgi:hypothetical protein
VNATTVSINHQGQQIAAKLRKKLSSLIYSVTVTPDNTWDYFVDSQHCGGFKYQGRWVYVEPEERGLLGCPALNRDEVRTAVERAIREVKNEKI